MHLTYEIRRSDISNPNRILHEMKSTCRSDYQDVSK